MHTAASGPSLIDNAEFFAELGKLEATPHEDTSDFPEPSAGARQKATMPGREPVAEARGQGPQFMMPPAPSEEPPIAAAQMPIVKAAPSSPAMRPALAMIGFVLMMLVGAGAAALVFHDRVALIVEQWQSASR